MSLVIRYVGTAGHHADWGSAYNWIVALGALIDDYNLMQISDLTNNIACAGSINLNGRKVSFLNYSGYKTTMNAGLNIFRVNTEIGSSGSIIIDSLNSKNTPLCGLAINLTCRTMANPFSAISICRNTSLEGANNNDSGLFIGTTYGNLVYVSNLKIWNFGNMGINCNYTTTGIGPHLTTIYRFFENITIYNCKYGFNFFNTFVGICPIEISLINVVSTHDSVYPSFKDWNLNVQYFWPAWSTNKIVLNNCADSDGTCFFVGRNNVGINVYYYGNNVIHNIVSINEYESLDDTDADFLMLKDLDGFFHISGTPRIGPAQLKTKFRHSISVVGGGEKLYNGGIKPVLSINDIAGKEYGQYGYYPIGCHCAQLRNLQEVWET